MFVHRMLKGNSGFILSRKALDNAHSGDILMDDTGKVGGLFAVDVPKVGALDPDEQQSCYEDRS